MEAKGLSLTGDAGFLPWNPRGAYVLADASDHADLGPTIFDERDERRVTRRLVHRRLEALG
jgi:hypothetical protein